MQEEILTTIHNIPIKRNFILNLPYNPSLKDRAKALRKAGNFSEVVFWKEVRNKSFWNIDFDRQRIIGNYIVDFYVKALGLVIEIDGEIHNFQEDYDEKRELFLKNLGLKIFRISTTKMNYDTESVMKDLEQFIISEYRKDQLPPRLSGTPPEEGKQKT
jgi:very-short-patch-repair endonuclease